MIKAVFLDFFNTLAGYTQSRERVYTEVCSKYRIPVDVKALVKAFPVADKYLRDQFRARPMEKRNKLNLLNLFMNHATILLKSTGIKINKIIAFRLVLNWMKYKWDFKLFEDALDILKYCKEKGMVTGIISNIDKDMTDISEKLGLKPYIDFYVTSQEAGCDKPSPEIFKLALQKAGIQPEEAIYTGDQYDMDIIGARDVGIKAILIDRNNWYPEITDCPRIQSLLELKIFL